MWFLRLLRSSKESSETSIRFLDAMTMSILYLCWKEREREREKTLLLSYICVEIKKREIYIILIRKEREYGNVEIERWENLKTYVDPSRHFALEWDFSETKSAEAFTFSIDEEKHIREMKRGITIDIIVFANLKKIFFWFQEKRNLNFNPSIPSSKKKKHTILLSSSREKHTRPQQQPKHQF